MMTMMTKTDDELNDVEDEDSLGVDVDDEDDGLQIDG